MDMDLIDKKAAAVFDGYLVRKDLVRTFSRQFPVPTYVVEFLLGRYCASIDQEEIEEGLEIVQPQLQSRTVKAGEEELFKARARENGKVKIIDLISARLDARSDSYVVTLPGLRLNDVRIRPELVREHERMLTGGFYAEINLGYEAENDEEFKGRPFCIEGLREIQLSKREVLDTMAGARAEFTTEEWKDFLLRSIGIEPGGLSERQKDAFMLRMVPFVERNYNVVELGPRGTGKSHLFQHRVFLGGALSGRDTNAVHKTVSGLLKLIAPGGGDVSDEDLEWAVRLGLESRRRVKEQQKRIGAAEFRNTHFSYVMGEDGVEKFVATPELQSESSIGSDPLEPGQVWTISPATGEEHPGLYRIEINEGPGSGVRILNKPVPAAFRESMGYAEQNMYTRSSQLVGDKDPRHHEFMVQLRAFDAAKSGTKLGVASLVALCTSLLKKSVRGGLIIVGEINLGGSIEPIHNPVTVAEIAVEKGATALLMPVTCRRQLFDLSDDMATKVDIISSLGGISASSSNGSVP